MTSVPKRDHIFYIFAGEWGGVEESGREPGA